MKIGRNDPCPCGNGKKYKKCCLNKSEENRFAEAIRYSISNIKNEARIKHCLHPNKEECSEKIVKAHAIQNNRILNRIAENGMRNYESNLQSSLQRVIGKGFFTAKQMIQQKK